MFGLLKEDILLITSVFVQYPQITKVNVFGSRALGNYRENSDIDLVIWGEIAPATLAQIMTQLDELPLPYLFDLKMYNEISHQAFKDHIDEIALPKLH
tara:strand:- start:1715 stop:2008 length:294 start_codon:yes stop_codon:yes gene_type:complete